MFSQGVQDNSIRGMYIATSGIKVQSARMRVISENIANANTLAIKKGGLPYARKTITFQDKLNKALGVDLVRVRKINQNKDPSQFKKRYEPSNPVADKDGYVLAPNVSSLVEITDMQEAMRSYTANLNMVKNSKTMLNQLIGLLKT